MTAPTHKDAHDDPVRAHRVDREAGVRDDVRDAAEPIAPVAVRASRPPARSTLLAVQRRAGNRAAVALARRRPHDERQTDRTAEDAAPEVAGPAEADAAPMVLRDHDCDPPTPPPDGTGGTGAAPTDGAGTGAGTGDGSGQPGTPGPTGEDGRERPAAGNGTAPQEEPTGAPPRPGEGGDREGGEAGDVPLTPAERAARDEGPLAPDAEHGYTERGELPGVDDPRVAELFEKRADPEAREAHTLLLAESEGTRLSALGYSYKPGGFAAAMLELVNPVPGFMEGVGRLTDDNIYSSGEGTLARIQSGIHRFRGLLKILDTLAGWVSTAATAVAIIAAITIVGVKVAAVAFKVSVIAGLLQAGIKTFDAFLGIVQLLLNIARARSTKDPVERARLVHQMKQESGMFADSLMGAVIDGVSSFGGGAGKAAVAAGKAGIKAGVKGGARAGLSAAARRGLFRGAAAARLARIKVKAGIKAVAKTAGQLRTVAGVRQMVGSAASSVGARIPGTAGWKAARLAEYNKKLAGQIAGLRGHARAKYHPDASWWSLSASSAKELGGLTAKKLGVDSAKGTAKAVTKVGMSDAARIAGGGPGGGGPGAGPAIGLTYHQVAYWPSILEEMGTSREGIHGAQTRMRAQYEKAAVDAGEKRAFIEGIKGTPSQVGTRLRMAGGRQKAEAEADEERADETKEQADKALKEEQEGKGKLDEAKGTGDEIMDDTAEAEAAAKGDAARKESSSGWWETTKDYARRAYRATLGRLFDGLNTVKKWIGKVVLKLALSAAGLGDDDLELAGMKSTAEEDAQAASEAQQDAQASEDEADAHDEQIEEAKAGASGQEAAAMQGMVDAGDWIETLDAYDQLLAQEQHHGSNYIADATEAVSAEVGAPLVTAAFVQPIVDGAAWITAQAGALPGELESAGGEALGTLLAAIRRNGLSGDAGEVAESTVAAWLAAASSLCPQIAAQAGALASGAQGLVGTDWFVVVDDEYAPALERLAILLDVFAASAAAGIGGVLGLVADTYGGITSDERDEEPVPVPAGAPAEPPDEAR